MAAAHDATRALAEREVQVRELTVANLEAERRVVAAEARLEEARAVTADMRRALHALLGLAVVIAPSPTCSCPENRPRSARYRW